MEIEYKDPTPIGFVSFLFSMSRERTSYDQAYKLLVRALKKVSDKSDVLSDRSICGGNMKKFFVTLLVQCVV